MSVWEGALGMAAMGLEATTFKPVEGDAGAIRAALDALAADPYRRLRLTHAGAIDRMIENLAGKELPWDVLLAAKDQLRLI